MRFVIQSGIRGTENSAVLQASMLDDSMVIFPASYEAVRVGHVAVSLQACPIGTVEFCRAWMKLCGIREPDPIDYPESLYPYLQREVRRFRKWDDVPIGAWVKPVQTKAWEARIKTPDMPAPGGGEVWGSEPLQIYAEWRLYFVGREFLGMARYDDAEPEYDEEPVLRAGMDMAQTYMQSGKAPAAYCLDIARVDHQQHALVEVTDAWACGYYPRGSCKPADFARMLWTRWQEIIGIQGTVK